MAGTPNRNEAEVHDIYWIGNELLEAAFVFSPDGRAEISFSFVGRSEDWEVNLPSVSDHNFYFESI